MPGRRPEPRVSEKPFGALLQQFMQRARIGDTQLARRIGKAPLSVRRWRLGQTNPAEDTIEALKWGLSWGDSAGTVRVLTDAEILSLRMAAGYLPRLAAAHEQDRIEPTNRCLVYSYRYSYTVFPSKWTARISDLERSVSGSLYLMVNGLSADTRPPTYYATDYYRHRYAPNLVDAYMVFHQEAQKALIDRFEHSVVKHIYTRKDVEDYLTTGKDELAYAPEDSQSAPSQKVSDDVLKKQLDTILAWLEYPNFQVALTMRPVPVNAMVLDHDLVLLEPRQSANLLSGDNIMGLEIIGGGAAAQFAEQFDAIWADAGTLNGKGEVIRWFKAFRDRLG